jgi:tetratricopeptide (TPR) repeat protein
LISFAPTTHLAGRIVRIDTFQRGETLLSKLGPAYTSVVVGFDHRFGVAVSLCLTAGLQTLYSQPTGAGTEASRAEQQQRYEQQRVFENTQRLEAKQDQFLTTHGLGPNERRPYPSRGYVERLSRPMRDSFVSVTSFEAPKTAKKALDDAWKELNGKSPDHKRCAALLEQAVTEYPEYAAAWTLLGTVRRKLGNPAGARDAFARSIEADAKYLEPYIEHANLALAESEWKEAVTVAGQLIKANPLFTLGYYYRGAALLRLGELKDAEKAAIQALKTVDAKVFPETHFLLGEIYAEQRDYPLAAREYRIYLAEGSSGEWGNYVEGRLKEWELLGIIEPASNKKRRG